MIKIRKEIFLSPLAIFFIYMIASGLVIMGFRYIIPARAVPLAYFSFPWRLIQGLLQYLELFPALVLSALVIPFGLTTQAQGKANSNSSMFLQALKMPIFTAIIGATLYGLLFSLALPLAQNYEANLLFKSRLYLLARERAQESSARGEWAEAAQLLTICETIWPKGQEHSKLKTEAEIRTEGARMAAAQLPNILSVTGSQFDSRNSTPVSAAEALALAETALSEERYYDAHWLATLGGQLARPDSVEVAMASRLAGRAWSGVNSLAPNAEETRLHSIYKMKRDGYEALLGEEYIRSYYIFLELEALSPEDSDLPRYLAMSENGVRQAAFFIDEMEIDLGRIITGAVFSFPFGLNRLVMRISSLSTSSDSAYGIGIEIMTFDSEGKPLWSIEAPYAKILPLTLETGRSVSILLRALDRTDKTGRWEPEAKSLGQSAPAGAEIVVPISWDDFILITNVRRGLSGLSSADLKRAAENLNTCGYLPQVFEAELLERFIKPLFLLPLGIFAIAIGWQYRALKRPRYMGIPMLGILPLVFNGAVYFSRSWLNKLGIWAVVSLGFKASALFFGIGITVLFVLSLIFLASKRK